MKGLHSKLNTNADYEYIRAHEPESSWKAAWQKLLDGQNCWQTIGADESVDDYEQKDVRTVSSGENETVTQVYKQDLHCKLFRIGFTVEEVESGLNAKN